MPVKTSIKKSENKQKAGKWQLVIKANQILGVIFYIIWILVGIFFLLYTTAAIRQGALDGLLGKPAGSPSQNQVPSETTIPGIGKVNVNCVQESLSADTIQKIITEGNTSTLTDEEKSKFEPCIVEKEQAQNNSEKQQ